MSCKVSVIIPVYNVEDYLEECVRSFIGQSLKDLEVVCVDDGSTDSSPKILEKLAKEDGRVKVIRRANAGAAIARNVGIDAACGDYPFFSDSDDFCDSGMLEAFVKRADELHADCILAGSYTYDQVSKTDMTRWRVPERVLKLKQPFAASDLSPHSFESFRSEPWNKLFRTSFVRSNGLRFQEGLFCANDVYFVCMAMALAERIGVVEEAYYHYRQNTGTGLTAKSDKAPLAFVEARKAVRDGLKARGREDLSEDLWNVFATTAAWRLMNMRDPVSFRKVYDCLHQGGLDYFKKKEFGFDGIAEPLFRRHAKMVYENDDPTVILLNEVWRLRKKQNDLRAENARVAETVSAPLKAEIKALKESTAYRVGMVVTWPIRRAASLVHKIHR